jgi:ElaB/YqjD/DUF883 family membrane-anchored ribosome-binding protein
MAVLIYPRLAANCRIDVILKAKGGFGMNMTELATATGDGVEQITKAMKRNLRALIGDMEEMLKATVDQTGDRIAAVRAKAEESLQEAKAQLAEQEAAVVAKTKAAARATDDYVRDNPWRALGITAAIALFVGILVARR